MNKKIIAISLIELVFSMLIISIALTSVILVFYQISKDNPTLIAQQATYVAKSYLTEILTKDFPASVPCLPPPANRADYTTVCDYRNLVNTGARDNKGNLILGLENFIVSVTVDTTSADLESLVPGLEAIRVDVIVTNPQQLKGSILLSGYRTKY